VLVLSGRSFEGEGAPALWPWVQVLRAIVRGREPSALHSAIGPGAPDIVRLLPELTRLLPDLPEAPLLAPEQSRFRLFDSITAFLRHIAAGEGHDAAPLLITLDDLQWADASSLLLLELLAGERAGTPILAVGTYREIEVRRGEPLARTLAGLRRQSRTTELVLSGVEALAVAMVRRLFVRSGIVGLT
jgi:predicted ATPase